MDDLSAALAPFVGILKAYIVGRVRRPEFAADFDRVHRAEHRSEVDERRSEHALLLLDGYQALVRSKKSTTTPPTVMPTRCCGSPGTSTITI